MKAKELYTKYHDTILSRDQLTAKKAAMDLIMDLSHEVLAIMKSRKTANRLAVLSIVHEVNDKYNAVGRLFETKDGTPILVENGFLKVWAKTDPSLETVSHLKDMVRRQQNPNRFGRDSKSSPAVDTMTMLDLITG